MKTRRERQIDRWRLCGAFLLTFAAFIAMLTGCASLPPNQADPQIESLINCAASEQCVVISIDNSAWNQAAIFVNGSRFATVEGKSRVTLPLRRSMLLEGGTCAQVTIRLLTGSGIALAKECVRATSGRFTLEIFDHLPNSVLTPWAGR